MSDDETVEDVLDEETIDDELFDGDGDEEGESLFDDDGDAEDDEASAETPVPLDASEDGDDELDGQPVVDLTAIDGLDVDDPMEVAEEDDEDPNDTIREGEFVCTSCHMAKRSSALADADEMLCRDCV